MRDGELPGKPDGTVWVGVILAFMLIGLSLIVLLSRTSADSADRGLDYPARPVIFAPQKVGAHAEVFAERADMVDPITYSAQ